MNGKQEHESKNPRTREKQRRKQLAKQEAESRKRKNFLGLAGEFHRATAPVKHRVLYRKGPPFKDNGESKRISGRGYD